MKRYTLQSSMSDLFYLLQCFRDHPCCSVYNASSFIARYVLLQTLHILNVIHSSVDSGCLIPLSYCEYCCYEHSYTSIYMEYGLLFFG